MTTGTKQETEVAIYAKVGNWDGLAQADSFESQYQAEIKTKHGKKIRVRKSTIDGNVAYTETIKIKDTSAKLDDSREVNKVIDAQFFEAFCEIAHTKQNKVRYNFKALNVKMVTDHEDIAYINLPEVLFKVDIFTKPDGTRSDWCKIDVELNSIQDFIKQNYPDIKDIEVVIKVSCLPLALTDSFIGSSCTNEQRSLLNGLFKNEFNTYG